MLHVPKTAGTSMAYHFKERIPSYQKVNSLKGPLDPEAVFTNLDHQSVARLIEKKWMTQEYFDSAFKFAFVRNTWDRLVSLYEYLKRARLRGRCREFAGVLVDFKTYIQTVTTRPNWVRPPSDRVDEFPVNEFPWFDQAYTQLVWLEWGVDFIGRYEMLGHDWERLCNLLAVEYVPLSLHRATIDKRTREHSDYRDYYNDKLKGMVADHYAEEIERFGFIF